MHHLDLKSVLLNNATSAASRVQVPKERGLRAPLASFPGTPSKEICPSENLPNLSLKHLPSSENITSTDISSHVEVPSGVERSKWMWGKLSRLDSRPLDLHPRVSGAQARAVRKSHQDVLGFGSLSKQFESKDADLLLALARSDSKILQTRAFTTEIWLEKAHSSLLIYEERGKDCTEL